MQRITSLITRLGAAFAMLLVLALATPAALAATENDVWEVVGWASTSNQNVLNQFTGAAVQATTMAQLDEAYGLSYDNLEYVWSRAVGDLEDLVDESPELESIAATAYGKILDDHNASHGEMDNIYFTIADRLQWGTTTTTAPASTTTTTTAPASTTTTTTAPASTTTTTTAPASTTTTTTIATTTTVEDTGPTTTTTRPRSDSPTSTTTTTTPTTTSDGGALPPPPGPGGGMMDHLRSVGNGQLWSAPPTPQSPTAVPTKAEMPTHAMSTMLTDTASVLLPPAVVSIAVAPIIVIEVLVMTLVESARSLMVPALLLAAAMAWFIRRERKLSVGSSA